MSRGPASHGPDLRDDGRPFGKRGATQGIALVVAATTGLVLTAIAIAAVILATMS